MRLLRCRNIFLYLLVQYATSEFIETGIGRIELFEELGQGAYGVVRRCRVVATGRHCAVKIEISKVPVLHMEEVFYKALGEHPGIPRMMFYGKPGKKVEKDQKDILVLELMGPSLMDIMDKKNFNAFSIKTVLLLGIQALYRTEYVHSKGILFMDNKPENWVMGATDLTNSLLHFIDYGLSKFYMVKGKHLQQDAEVIGGAADGTFRYISLNAHRHKVLSRRDDIESIGYVLIYLLKGLPWTDHNDKERAAKSEAVLKEKNETSLKELIGPDHPAQLSTFIDYARSLTFYQKPKYFYLRRLLRDALAAIGAVEDYLFDWSEPRHLVSINKHKDKAQFFWSIRLRARLDSF